MLSVKKSIIGQSSVEFLGMILKDGNFQPGPHIAQELLHFPDQDMSRKQIQQFLGIVNYLRDFIPHVARHTSHLSIMLKKSAPPWGPIQTKAVHELKQLCQQPVPLKILTDGQRILQTDASDNYWGAILLERLDDKEYYCAHASGQFKESKNTTTSSTKKP